MKNQLIKKLGSTCLVVMLGLAWPVLSQAAEQSKGVGQPGHQKNINYPSPDVKERWHNKHTGILSKLEIDDLGNGTLVVSGRPFTITPQTRFLIESGLKRAGQHAMLLKAEDMKPGMGVKVFYNMKKEHYGEVSRVVVTEMLYKP